MKKTFLLIAMFLFFACIFGFTGCIKRKQIDDKTTNESIVTETDTKEILYSVSFIIDGQLYDSYSKPDGSLLSMPEIEPQLGFVFKGWYLDSDFTVKWDFNTDTIDGEISLYGFWIKESEDYYQIIFKDGDEILKTQNVDKGLTITEITPTEKFGYNFIGWGTDGEIFDFSKPIECDYTLEAIWELIEFKVIFVADRQVIDTCNYSVENQEIAIPTVPFKNFYDGKWKEFKLNFEDIIVEAIYTPIIYKATFIVDGATYTTITYTAEDKNITMPSVPEKNGYTSQWSQNFIGGGDVIINAIYTPIKYTATYVAYGEIVDIVNFTIETKSLDAPEVPLLIGYSGAWEETKIQATNLIINAEYTLKIYKAEFIVDGQVISTSNFSIEDMQISEPALPQKNGYTASWSDYNLWKFQDLKIYAIYTPIPSTSPSSPVNDDSDAEVDYDINSDITPDEPTENNPVEAEIIITTYYAVFMADNVVIEKVPYTSETYEIEEPEIPVKDGYTGKWESYRLSTNDIIVKAEYEIVSYSVIFIADDSIIDTKSYTVLDMTIEEPVVPQKDGYIGKWQNYKLNLQNITVYAEYLPIALNDEFTYRSASDGTYIVTGYEGSDINLLIPSTHNGIQVKQIDEQAFLSNDKIVSVEISYGIEIIGDSAFMACTSLKTVKLPESIHTIGAYAFNYSALQEINLPNSLIEIGKYAFSDTNLKSITIPLQITTISKSLFTNCKLLEKVIFSDSVSKLEDEVFSGCASLVEINLKNVNQIGQNILTGCVALKTVIIDESCDWILLDSNGQTYRIIEQYYFSMFDAASMLTMFKDYTWKKG